MNDNGHMAVSDPPPVILTEEQWTTAANEHRERVRAFTEPYLERRSAGKKHPVEDFLFTYYNEKPGKLLRWHPGAGVVLTGSAAVERINWKHYRALTETEQHELKLDGDAVTVDRTAFLRDRGSTTGYVQTLLGRTAARPGHFGCFGLHEWAMTYKSGENGIRHDYLNLRLGADGTDRVVEESRIKCTHFDAFRFYTPQAVELNELQPTRQSQPAMEQPGCLHANMDLYKWAYKLTPWLPSELVMDCFELSWRIREMDMQASPYDLAEWGYQPIRIEEPAGKAHYVSAQRAFAEESAALRSLILQNLSPAEL